MYATLQAGKTSQAIELLDEWYHLIRSQNFIKAKLLRNEIEELNQSIEMDSTEEIYYSLLEYRYQLLVEDLPNAEKALKRIEPFKETNKLLTYCYYFFKAIHSTLLGNYGEAKSLYKKAKSLLEVTPNYIEKAEFYYKMAMFYYHVLQPLPAVYYSHKAMDIFVEEDGYEINTAGCENILGLSCITLKQYEVAEEHLHSALDIVKKKKQDHIAVKIRYNLGLLYADQNLSEVAINYLVGAYEDEDTDYKTTFVLAREHFKIGKTKHALELIEKGLKICDKLGSEEYKHLYSILYTKINKSIDETKYEKAMKYGIEYFEQNEMLGYIQEYSEELAIHFNQKENHKQASNFFLRAYKAKEKVNEKGALN